MRSETWQKVAALVLVVGIAVGCGIAWARNQDAIEARSREAARINAAPRPAQTAGATPLALFVGDTFVTGTGKVVATNTFPYRAAVLLDWDCRVDGAQETGFLSSSMVGGRARSPYINRLRGDAALFRPDVVVVTGGGVDAGKPGLEAAALTYFTSVQKAFPGAEVVDVLPFWVDERPPKPVVDARAAIRRAAGRAGVEVIDPNGWLWADASVDGVHPDGYGHEVIARKLAPLLADSLARAKETVNGGT